MRKSGCGVSTGLILLDRLRAKYSNLSFGFCPAATFLRQEACKLDKGGTLFALHVDLSTIHIFTMRSTLNSLSHQLPLLARRVRVRAERRARWSQSFSTTAPRLRKNRIFDP